MTTALGTICRTHTNERLREMREDQGQKPVYAELNGNHWRNQETTCPIIDELQSLSGKKVTSPGVRGGIHWLIKINHS